MSVQFESKAIAEYHRRQYSTPYRSTVALAAFLRDVLGSSAGCIDRVIDLGTGGGANIGHLAEVVPRAAWTGVDRDPSHFDIGRSVLGERHPTLEVKFVEGDVAQLPAQFRGAFDLALCIGVLSVLPSYQAALPSMLNTVRPGGWFVCTSMFTESLVEATILVRDYAAAPEGAGPYYYNVYCLERFVAFARGHGAIEVVERPFNIDIDLAPPKHRGLGTYTQCLESGERIQFTGPVHLPWRIVAFRMTPEAK